MYAPWVINIALWVTWIHMLAERNKWKIIACTINKMNRFGNIRRWIRLHSSWTEHKIGDWFWPWSICCTREGFSLPGTMGHGREFALGEMTIASECWQSKHAEGPSMDLFLVPVLAKHSSIYDCFTVLSSRKHWLLRITGPNYQENSLLVHLWYASRATSNPSKIPQCRFPLCIPTNDQIQCVGIYFTMLHNNEFFSFSRTSF